MIPEVSLDEFQFIHLFMKFNGSPVFQEAKNPPQMLIPVLSSFILLCVKER